MPRLDFRTPHPTPGSASSRAMLPCFAALAAAVLLGAPVVAQEAGAPVAGAPAGGAPTAVPVPPPPPDWTIMPPVISTYGADIDRMFWVIFWITGVLFVVTEVLLVYFVIKYRHREGRTKAVHLHGSHKLEVGWTLGTAAVLVFVAVYQLGAWVEVKQHRPDLKQSLLVRVFGQQFAWFFNYPGPDGKWEEQRPWFAQSGGDQGTQVGLDTPANDITRSELLVPSGVPVVIELHSLGKFTESADPNNPLAYTYIQPVLHSFFSPHLRFKQDLVPYHPQTAWFEILPGKEGTYEIVCAELCGEGHFTMKAPFRVVTPEEWVREMGYDWRTANPGEFPAAHHIDEYEKYLREQGG